MTDFKIVGYDANKLYLPQALDRLVADKPVLLNDTLTVAIMNGRTLADDGTKLDFLNVTGSVDIDTVAARVNWITVTQAVDLDAIETRVNSLDASVVLKGTWDASGVTFPTSIKAGESWICSVPGTVDGVSFELNDRIIALVDGASAGTYITQWYKVEYTADVISVAGRIGAVVLTEADISDLQPYLVAADVNDLEAVTVGLTAFAGGGQGSATPVYEGINIADIVATAGDSFLLPVAVAGMNVTVRNNGVAAANLFPRIANKIDALAENAAISIPIDGSVLVKAYNNTSWLKV